MSNTYEPEQELQFLYIRNEKQLYINSNLSVPVNTNDILNLNNIPRMTAEATITLKAASTDSVTPNPCKQEIQIPLINFRENIETTEQIREKIKEDLKAKNINGYAVKVSIQKSSGETVGRKTSTISGDAHIKTT